MKKYLVAGLLLSSLLVGCGQENASTKKDTPKSEQEVKRRLFQEVYTTWESMVG